MKNRQQNQAKKFFELDAKNWSVKAQFKKNKILNTILERNLFVLKIIKKHKLKYHLDVGCGSGDLSYASSKIVNRSIGIDFAKNMIVIANKKFKRKNLEFFNKSVFNYQPNINFDCISANGFIEYLSLLQISKLLNFSYKNLIKNGFIIMGSRNRLFNLFSLNEFSKKEIRSNVFAELYTESINLNTLKFKDFLKQKKLKFEEASFKQPKTGINVDKRHQFTPSQLIDILERNKFKVIEISPINYHPTTPKIYSSNVNYHKFSNYVTLEKNKLSLIPFSSSFMIAAKKI